MRKTFLSVPTRHTTWFGSAFAVGMVFAVGSLSAAAGARPAFAQDAAPIPAPEAALIEAVQRRDARAVAALVAGGADVNASRADGSTPLAWAALRDAAGIVETLLQAGADPHVADENGETPLLFACGNGNLELARMLLDAGAAVDAARWNGDTPLMAAVHAGNEALVRLLVERGAAVNVAERRMGQTTADVGRSRRPRRRRTFPHRIRGRRERRIQERFPSHPVRGRVGRRRQCSRAHRGRRRPARHCG